jgi:membrane protein
MFSKVIKYLTEDIWRVRLRTFPPKKAFLIKHLRVILLAVRGYQEDSCKFRASALTFLTLLSIVPILALMFGIAKGFEMQKMVEDMLMEKVQGNAQLIKVLEYIFEFSNELLKSTKGGLVAGIGVIILFMSVIGVLGDIESSFNYIWGVQKPRSFSRKFGDYLAVILVCPVLLIFSGSVTVFVSSQIESITEKLQLLGAFQKTIFMMLKLLPFCSLWVVFSFIFIFMPNTKVKLSSGILAGIVAGTIFQLTQMLYINSQLWVGRYNAVYGSFAALPLFLVWLKLSWFIVLFGAEVSFAHQNVDTFELEPDCLKSSRNFKNKIAVLITNLLAKNFSQAKPALSASGIGQELDLPIRLIRDLLNELTEANILSEVIINGNKDVGYQPARDVENLTIMDVINSMEQKGSPLDLVQSDELDKINNAFKNLLHSNLENQNNLKVKDL